MLDYYFTAFDQIITSLGLEKIKTVGDAYICVGGLPEANAAHAEKVVRAALKQQDVMAQHPAGWNIRIGIHSGSVVAGIVGSKKFAYDIWGDTVNTASRMESHGAPGKINISRATYELLKNNPAFIFVNKVVNTVGAEKVIFGSDYNLGLPLTYIPIVDSLRIPASDKELIFSGNIMRLIEDRGIRIFRI